MALEFTLESLEGVDESLHGMYKEVDGVFKLDVSGLPEQEDVSGLKSALEKERESRKAAEKAAKELQAKKDEERIKTKEENEQFKELYEDAKNRLQEMQEKVTNVKKTSFLDKLANKLTDDKKQSKLLKAEMGQFIFVEDDDISIKGLAGVETEDQFVAHFREEYPFLVNGSQASGGGASGKKGGGAASNVLTSEQFSKLGPREKMEHIRKYGPNSIQD